MKKYLMSVIVLFSLSLFMIITVHADTPPTACGTGEKLVVLHYYRYDGDYSQVNLWMWNTGVSTQEGHAFTKTTTDNFGAVFDICVSTDTSKLKSGTDAQGNTTYSFGFDPVAKLSATDNTMPDWSTKDSFNSSGAQPDIYVDVTNLVAANSAQTQEDVYFVSGSDGVIYGVPGYGTAIVAYFDSTLQYKGYDAYYWANDGAKEPGWSDTTPFTVNDYYNQAVANQMELIGVPVGTTSTGVDSSHTNSFGFIIRNLTVTPNVQTANLYVDMTGIQGSGAKLFFYAAGQDATQLTSDAASFTADAFNFHFVPFTLSTLSGTYAVTPELIKVSFNQNVVLTATDSTGKVTQVFQPSFFSLTDTTTSTVISPSDYTVVYLPGNASTNAFAIQITNKDSYLNNKDQYTLAFDNGKTDSTKQQASINLSMDTSAPTIALVGSTNNVIKVVKGSAFTFPQYIATDDRDGDITNKVFVPTNEGYLNTGKTGDYKITLEAVDTWGNVGTYTFTVDVTPKISTPIKIVGVVVIVAIVAAGALIITKKLSKNGKEA